MAGKGEARASRAPSAPSSSSSIERWKPNPCASSPSRWRRSKSTLRSLKDPQRNSRLDQIQATALCPSWAQQFGWRTDRDDPAGIHLHHSRGQAPHLFARMRDVGYRYRELVAHALDQSHDFETTCIVEP